MNRDLINALETKRKRRKIELNITPFVDVMLVLVTMLMAVSQASVGTIDVDLPSSSSAHSTNNSSSDPVIITVSKDFEVYLIDEIISIEELIPKLRAIANQNKDLRIYIKGDKMASYNNIVQIVSMVNQAGFTKVALVTNSITEKPEKMNTIKNSNKPISRIEKTVPNNK